MQRQHLADDIAITALNHYNHVLPLKGKPKENEWSVYAAIVASKPKPNCESQSNDISASLPSTPSRYNLWVVSCATGTKCCAIPSQQQQQIQHGTEIGGNNWNTNTKDMNHCHILRDSHAEVLTRRGLIRVLWNEIITIQKGIKSSGNFKLPDNDSEDRDNSTMLLKPIYKEGEELSFTLRDDVELHMYISDSPCGDASIYGIKAAQSLNGQSADTSTTIISQKFTGSKVIFVNESHIGNDASTTLQLVREPDDQCLGQLRTKSGRSNIDPCRRSLSMSCSDKLVRWSILGLQGGILWKYIPKPIFLTSVVVGKDPAAATIEALENIDNGIDHSESSTLTQNVALYRAIPNRVAMVQEFLRNYKNIMDEVTSSDSFIVSDVDVVNVLHKYANEIMITPNVYTTKHTYQNGKAMMEYKSSLSRSSNQLIVNESSKSGKRRRNEIESNDCNNNKVITKFAVAGIAIAWYRPLTAIGTSNNDVELIVGVRGIRQGKKPKCNNDSIQLQSLLSRNQLIQLHECYSMNFRDNIDNKNKVGTSIKEIAKENYHRYKQLYCHPTYRIIRQCIFTKYSPLAGWIIGSTNNNDSHSIQVVEQQQQPTNVPTS